MVARRRPIEIVAPGTRLDDLGGAPYAAVEADLDPAVSTTHLGLGDGRVGLDLHWDGRRVALGVEVDGATRLVRSRRHGRTRTPTALALSLTGRRVCAFSREGGEWVARAMIDLDPDLAHGLGPLVTRGDVDRAGHAGQLGLRDVRAVSHPGGRAVLDDAGRVLLTATSAGPGAFASAHASVWSLDPETYDLEHRADLFFRRPSADGATRTYGDHAIHLLRHEHEWLVATSTWGDFDLATHPHVGMGLGRSSADLLHGTHVFDTEPLVVAPGETTPPSVGTWDPHLLRRDGQWWLAHVSARRFFSFHPVLAAGPSLDDLHLRGSAGERRACEGSTLADVGGRLVLMASEGADGARRQRRTYPVLDVADPALGEIARLDAVYTDNIAWPTLVRLADRCLLIGFDGRPAGGRLPGYGSHGALVVQRADVGPDGLDRIVT